MLLGCNGLVNLAWCHPAIVVFVGHWMMMVLLFVQLLVELISKHYPPKKSKCHLKRDRFKRKIVLQPTFLSKYLSFACSRKNILWQHFGKAKLLLLQLLLSVHENHRLGNRKEINILLASNKCLDRMDGISNRHAAWWIFQPGIFFVFPDY